MKKEMSVIVVVIVFLSISLILSSYLRWMTKNNMTIFPQQDETIFVHEIVGAIISANLNLKLEDLKKLLSVNNKQARENSNPNISSFLSDDSRIGEITVERGENSVNKFFIAFKDPLRINFSEIDKRYGGMRSIPMNPVMLQPGFSHPDAGWYRYNFSIVGNNESIGTVTIEVDSRSGEERNMRSLNVILH